MLPLSPPQFSGLQSATVPDISRKKLEISTMQFAPVTSIQWPKRRSRPQAPTAGLFILYGRRRVGKTRLLSHWLESRRIENALYWTATTHGAPYQLRDFSQQLLRFDPRFQAPPTPDFSFSNWEAALENLAELAKTSTAPLTIIVDEFTYLIRHEPALVSVLQKAWDLSLSLLPNLRLVLTGSMVGMMERDVLSYQAPLYGRATRLFKAQVG
jgi:AAA+ ATPase superfamily predicted ATPase